MNLLCNRPNEIMKTQRGEKANIILILAVSDFTTTVAHPSMTASKENKLPPSLSGLKFSMNPAMMGSQEQTMMNSC